MGGWCGHSLSAGDGSRMRAELPKGGRACATVEEIGRKSKEQDSSRRSCGSKSGNPSEELEMMRVEMETGFLNRGGGIQEFWITGLAWVRIGPCFPRLPQEAGEGL